MIFITAVICTLCASPAPGAVRYEGISRNDGGPWQQRVLTPIANQAELICWQVYQTQEAVTTEWVVRGCDGALNPRCAEWSNPVHLRYLRAGELATLMPERHHAFTHRIGVSSPAPEWQRAPGVAGYALPLEDVTPARIWTQAEVQAFYSARIRELYPWLGWYDPACGCYRDPVE